jgi:DNA-binding transcriptional ArsR family regulator
MVEYDGASDNPGLDATFFALADPTRREILARLAQGDATVNELAEPFAMSVQAVSKHLKVLERAGLVARGRSAQYRPCRLESDQLDQLEQAAAWIAEQRSVWADRLDRLDTHLQAVQRKQRRQRRQEKKR